MDLSAMYMILLMVKKKRCFDAVPLARLTMNAY